MAKTTCRIRWITDHGTPTPDTNEATVLVRRRAYNTWLHGRLVQFPDTEWFPCCAVHAAQLNKRGMEHWESKPISE
jgi:hypothetical protein